MDWDDDINENVWKNIALDFGKYSGKRKAKYFEKNVNYWDFVEPLGQLMVSISVTWSYAILIFSTRGKDHYFVD